MWRGSCQVKENKLRNSNVRYERDQGGPQQYVASHFKSGAFSLRTVQYMFTEAAVIIGQLKGEG
jgi:hypothetical protein